MRRIGLVLWLVSVFLAGMASNSYGVAYLIYDQDAKAQAQGGAFVAQADNPAAIYYNPAGITQLGGTNVSVGGEFVKLSSQFENQAGLKEDLQDQWSFVPNMYLTSNLGTEKLAVGLGVNVPFGLSTSWSKNGLLRYDATFTSLEMFNINPTIAYKILPELSVGAGVDWYYVRRYDINAMVDYGKLVGMSGAFDGKMGYEGDGNGWGFNLGALYKPHKMHSFGLNFRSAVDVNTEGKYKLTQIPAFMNLGGELSFNASTEINYPPVVTLGYAFRPIEKWKLEFDANWFGWSSTGQLKVNNEEAGGALLEKTLDWKDCWVFALGTEYLVTDKLSLRCGYAYVQPAIPEDTFSPSVPDSERQVIALGLGYKLNRFNFELAYSYIFFNKREIDENIHSTTVLGTYDTNVQQIGFTLGYKF